MSLSTTKTRDYPKVDPRRGVNYLKFIASTTYTTTNEDKGQVLIFEAASPSTVTLAALSVPIGSQIDFIKINAGSLTFVAESGVIIRSKNATLTLSTPNTAATAIRISNTDWVLVGDLS